MIKGTFCDWLMNQGVRFHPETVIVDVALAPEYYSHGLHHMEWQPIGVKALPPFAYMFFEWQSIRNGSYYGFYCSHPKEPIYDMDGNKLFNWGATVRGVSFIRFDVFGKTVLHMANEIFYYEINQRGICDTYLKEPLPHTNEVFSELTALTFGGVNIFESQFYQQHEGIYYDDQFLYYAHVAIHGIQAFHQRAPIELVDHHPRIRRKVAKREGKEPSPYFRIITPGQPQKRYKPNGKRPKQIKNMPLHSVRGHFRINPPDHPISHFADESFWIAAHTRGDKKLGKLVKHYKIRLPESDTT